MATKSESFKKADKISGAREDSRYKAPALDKGLDILELLAEEKSGLSRKEISMRLGRSIHEIFRMLVCLEERGYIEQGLEKDNLVLSRKLFELGLRHPPNERLIEAAEPILLQLSQTLGQGCHITVPSSNCMLVVAQQNSPQKLSLTVSVGTTVPFQSSVSGMVFLAYQSKPLQESLLAKSEPTKEELTYLKAAIAKTQTDGFFHHQSKIAKGVTESAFPIFGHTGRVVAALSVPVLTILEDELEKKFLIEKSKLAAEEISLAIGWDKQGRKV